MTTQQIWRDYHASQIRKAESDLRQARTVIEEAAARAQIAEHTAKLNALRRETEREDRADEASMQLLRT